MYNKITEFTLHHIRLPGHRFLVIVNKEYVVCAKRKMISVGTTKVSSLNATSLGRERLRERESTGRSV